jgi:hypothetical protein
VEVIDPVGAGDAFNSGFLYAYTRALRENAASDSSRSRRVSGDSGNPSYALSTRQLQQALALGCVCGSLCISKRGCCADPPRLSEARRFAVETLGLHEGLLPRPAPPPPPAAPGPEPSASAAERAIAWLVRPGVVLAGGGLLLAGAFGLRRVRG